MAVFKAMLFSKALDVLAKTYRGLLIALEVGVLDVFVMQGLV